MPNGATIKPERADDCKSSNDSDCRRSIARSGEPEQATLWRSNIESKQPKSKVAGAEPELVKPDAENAQPE